MPAQPVRYGRPDPTEPVIHELPPLRWAGGEVPVQVEVRRDADGMWRGRILFGAGEDVRATAEILCAVSEPEFWLAVGGLNSHHLRDLYRSMSE